jgi:HTH-type transcriptional regulator, competence development regulator
MKTLGQTLKLGREGNNWTLRDVEDATGVSNAYLSQLENDKIKKPSANVLYKLAAIYGITLDSLLEAAGIIDKSINKKPNAKITLGGIVVTEDEVSELVDYLTWIRFKKRRR